MNSAANIGGSVVSLERVHAAKKGYGHTPIEEKNSRRTWNRTCHGLIWIGLATRLVKKVLNVGYY